MKYNLIILFIALSGMLSAQTWIIEPGTLNCGNVLVSQSSDGTHSFTFSAEIGEEDVIYIESTNYPAFQVSNSSSSGFSDILTLNTDASGVISDTLVYVKFTPTSKGSYGDVTFFVYDDLGYIDLEEKLVTGGGVAPEVEVRGNSLAIADGDNTPSVDDDTNFGSTAIGSYTEKTFTINNIAGLTEYDGDLLLSGSPKVEISGTHAADYSIELQPSSPLERNTGTTTFIVRFTPSASGARDAVLEFANNDLNENPFNFSITGTGTNPEIDIRGNGILINNGDLIPSTADYTDFGGVDAQDGMISRTFYIHNSGTGDLTLADHNSPNGVYVWIDGDNAADFSVLTQPATPIAAASNDDFEIECNPSALGIRTAVVHVNSNDANEASYSFTIQGRGLAPEIDLQGNSMSIANNDATPSSLDHTDFGSANVDGSTIVRTFTVFNINSGVNAGPLKFTGGSPYVTIGGTHAAEFSLTALPSTPVTVGNGTTFQITFDPSGTGTRSASISIANNDLDESTYTFSIQGTGATIPTLTTTAISAITSTAASSGGNVTSNGGFSVTAKGVCWSTSTDPTIANDKTSDGTGTGVYTSSISGLNPATNYFVRAYATNSIGTGYGSNQSFWTLATEPGSHPANFISPAKTQASITLQWDATAGADGYIILQRSGTSGPGNTGVVDATAPASLTFSVGTTLAATVTAGTTTTISGLTAGTDYSFTIFAYAKGENNATYNYKTDGTLTKLTVKTVKTAPTTQATGLTFSNITENTLTAEWIRGNGDSCLVLIHETLPVDTDPANGSTYNQGTSLFNDGDQIGTNNFVAYKGTGTLVNLTGLSGNTSYYLEVFEFNNGGANSIYKTDGGGANNPKSVSTIKPDPTLQSQNLVFSNIATTSLTISWNRGNGDACFVIASVGNNLSNPEDDVVYSANTIFGSGSEITTGCYVVYKGTASTANITGLSLNTNYYFKVMEYNNAGTSDPRYLTTTETGNLNNTNTLKLAPTTQSTNVSFSNIKATSLTVGWTRGNGEYCLLIGKMGGSVSNPSDNVTYTANSVFGSGSNIASSGSYVLYAGNDANPSIEITNLTANQTYYFKAIEYNNHGSAYIKYYTATATGNPASVIAQTLVPTTQSSSLVVSDIESAAASVTWTAGNGEGRIILAKAVTGVNSNPVDGTEYAASNTFGTGSEIGTGNFVVYDGTGNSLNLSGLTPGTTYYARAYEYNGSGTNIKYYTATATNNPVSFTTYKIAPTVQASEIEATPTNTTADISFTTGNGDKRIVVFNSSNSYTNPVNGTDPAANAAWQNGGEQIVYNGTGNSLTVTGLIPNTIYYVRVFEYNNTGTKTAFNTSAETQNPASFTTLYNEVIPDISGNWDNPAIWGGSVPGPDDNVVIGAGVSITIPAGKATAECHDLTLAPTANLTVDGSLSVGGNLLAESDASGTASIIDNGTLTVTGTKNIEIYIAQSDRYYYLSVPVSGQTADAFGDVGGVDKLFYRNTTESSWSEILSGATLLEPLTGYATKQSVAPTTLTFSGNLNTGAKAASLTDDGDRWNLVGNPYPSPIDWGTENDAVAGWTRSNIRNTIYIKHGDNFATFNATGDGAGVNDGSRYIPAMQSFWIKVLGPGASLNMSNPVRLHNSNPLLKNNVSETNSLRLKISRDGFTDETMVRFLKESDNGTDKSDAEKMFASGTEYPQIYTMVENENMAINSFAEYRGTFTLNLGFKTAMEGNFEINFAGIETFPLQTAVYLEDKLMHKQIKIASDVSYSFYSEVSHSTDRFVLYFNDGTSRLDFKDPKNTTNVSASDMDEIKIFGNKNSIKLYTPGISKAEVQVYNILGSLLKTADIQSENSQIELENIQGGTLIVKIVSEFGVISRKINL